MPARINPGGGKGQEKIWRGAVARAVMRLDGDARALERLADKLIAKGKSGDVAALREIGDRLDGRPAQDLTIKADATEEFLAALRAISAVRALRAPSNDDAKVIELKAEKA